MCGALLADAGVTVGEEARFLSWKPKIVNNDNDSLIGVGGGTPHISLIAWPLRTYQSLYYSFVRDQD